MPKLMKPKGGKDSNTKEILIKFMKTTSIRGLPRIINSESKTWRMVHIVFFLSALTLTTYMVQQTLTDYFQYHVSTKTYIIRDGENAYFPDITLCNINPHSDKFEDYLRDVLLKALNKSDIDTSGLNDNDIFDIWKTVEKQGMNGWLNNITNSLTFVHTSLTSRQQEMSGHKKEDFIRDCNMMAWYGEEEQACKMDHIILHRDLQKLNCYTFQLQTQQDKLQMRKTCGVSFVLFLAPTKHFVFPEIPKYFPSSNGVIVYIHEPNTMPSKSKGFTVSPGFETRVSMSVVHSIQQPAPYGNCKEDFENIKSGDREFVYEYDTCIAKCAQEAITKTCRCLWEEAPPFGDYSYCKNVSLPIKTLINNMKCQYDASTKLVSSYNSGQKLCNHCKDKCKKYTYLNSISQSVWPDVSTHLGIYKQYIQNVTKYKDFFTEYEELLIGKGKNLNMTEKYTKLRAYNRVKDSLIKLDVMLNSKDVMTYEQKKIWTPVSLCASLAATLIFGIGFTYFAVAEILECIFNIIKSCFKSRKNTRDFQSEPDRDDIKMENLDHTEYNTSTLS
ncbi:unnamed protein product [Owenia fusiformis]|uniref:Uncharacterized protein n=1 Tax=Owenia fusiformis TaxID=6347 RepID=A0A8J1TZN8_OWEFU|nr:unnamed protein product [Owenia fusiformis]